MTFVEVPQPFDFTLTTERFRAFGPDLADIWVDDALYRVIGNREVRVSEAPGGVEVEPWGSEIEAVVLRLLGADFDLVSFRPRDAVLAAAAKRLRGFRPPIAPDPFEMMVGAICAQQISLRAAFAVRNRFIERYGVKFEHAYAFPTRERVASESPEELRGLGFSLRKAQYVLGLARAEIDWAGLAELPDEEVRAILVALPGIGEWTADWFLARHLARPHAWPAGDLALRYAVSDFYGDGRVLSIQETRRLAERFHPWENLSAHYLLSAHRNPA